MSNRFEEGHFIGSLRSARHVGGLTLAETEYAAGLRVPSHAHAHALCSLVLAGSFTEKTGSRRAAVEAGSLIFQPPDEPHAHDFHDAGSRCFNVQFGAAWVERMELFSVRPPTSSPSVQSARASWLGEQLYREFCTPDSASILAIEGFALALLGEIARSAEPAERSGPKPGWLLRAVEQLHERWREPLRLTELARVVDIDPSHLARSFRQFYGCTMSEYLRRLRVERARSELLTTAQPLSAIAFSAGFADQAHFCRVFKELVGVTPGEFRRSTVR